MRKSTIHLLTVVTAMLLAFSSLVQAQAGKPVPYQEGLHYTLIEQASAESRDSVEVNEFFSYLCTHCNTFEPYISAWKKRIPENVNFRRVPVVFGRSSWELYARAYVTAELMNAPVQAHDALMAKLWKEKDILRTMDQLADFYVQFGIDKEKFLSTSRSFAVDGMMRRNQLLGQSYGIRSTPSLVVNGKYHIVANAAVPSFEVMLDVVDYLIGVETEAMQLKAAAIESVPASEGIEGG